MDVSFTLGSIKIGAAPVADLLLKGKVVALSGEMGAGKTTLVSAVCNVLAITDAVSSPTFSIINEYRLPTGASLFHLDLYRLNDEEEARAAGIEDCLNSGSACIAEWPEKTPALFPPETVHCELIITGVTTRMLRINL